MYDLFDDHLFHLQVNMNLSWVTEVVEDVCRCKNTKFSLIEVELVKQKDRNTT